MAANFKISVHWNSDNLHLKLMGDFDGSSAHELINTLKRNSRGAVRVFIHTNCLKQIHPFGKSVFFNNLNTLNIHPAQFVFTGENKSKLGPISAHVSQ